MSYSEGVTENRLTKHVNILDSCSTFNSEFSPGNHSGDKLEQNDGRVGDSKLQLNQSMRAGLGRFVMFNIVVKSCLETICAGVSDKEYVNLFGKLKALKKSKSAPQKMQKRMQTNLLESLNADIDMMIEDEKLRDKMQTLDKLVEESPFPEGTVTWRPSGDVTADIRSHNMAVKMSHKAMLEECVREREHASEALRQQVCAMRKKLKNAESRLQMLYDQSCDCFNLDSIDKTMFQAVHR